MITRALPSEQAMLRAFTERDASFDGVFVVGVRTPGISWRPGAVRAVGTASGANANAIIVPCHRVIAADGRLVRYCGAMWRKQRLLDLERDQDATATRP